MMKSIYKKILNSLAIGAMLFGSVQLDAQLSFTNSNSLLTTSDWHSGVAVGVVDMNNDNLDDILRLSQSQILTIEYQDPNGGLFIPYTYGSISMDFQWAIAAADANNDGYTDVICGDRYKTKIIMANADGTDYTHEVLPGDDFFAQGSNFADINNDGWLDIFVCNDDAESRIWSNDGTGAFTQADDWIDMKTTPVSDNSGNYGSIWTDFDNDGDIDLYIAKCRQGVGNPSDPRRINALFVNDGNGNYTEEAADFNIKIGYQSWTSDFNDIDNDGDMDIFITNHDFANQVLENDGAGHFTDISTNQNIGIATTSFPIQGVMRDFDNDGFMDILISGSAQHLYRNNGDKTFTEVTGLFDSNGLTSYALGDLNNDGFIDVYGAYGDIYVTPSFIDDVIWLNDANDNNWFGVDLVGTVSNEQAVGARVEIYGPWGVQIREVRAGESYGITNSLRQNFGLGESTAIDQVVVKWPSGRINVIENPTINEYLTIVETECEPFAVNIEADGATIICSGETVGLTAPVGYNYLWSNGSTSAEIIVSEAGTYNVVVENMMTGCYSISQNIIVQNEPDETPTIEVDGDLEFCAGGSVTLTASEASSYEWSNNETTQSIVVSAPGDYFVTTMGACAEYDSEIYTVATFDTPAPQTTDIDVMAGPVTLTATGDNPQWWDAEVGGTFLGEGNTLEIASIMDPTTYWVEDMVAYGAAEEEVGMETHLGSGSGYNGDQFNAGITFDAFAPFTIESALFYTDIEGERTIQLIDGNGTLVESLVINIPVAPDEGTRIDLNIEVPVGLNMILTTDGDFNNITLGTTSPRLKRSNTGVNYGDYEIEDVLQMNGSSTGGTSRYYYFFDWEVKPEGVDCFSERVPLNVDIISSTLNIDGSNEVQLYPNPTDGQVNLALDFDQSTDVNLKVMDLTGKAVHTEKIGTISGQYTKELSLAHLAKGIYMVQVITPEHTFFGKIAIQ